MTILKREQKSTNFTDTGHTADVVICDNNSLVSRTIWLKLGYNVILPYSCDLGLHGDLFSGHRNFWVGMVCSDLCFIKFELLKLFNWQFLSVLLINRNWSELFNSWSRCLRESAVEDERANEDSGLCYEPFSPKFHSAACRTSPCPGLLP